MSTPVSDAATCSKIDINSVKKICTNSDQVMVYGPRYCQYFEVQAVLENEKDTFKNVFAWTIADPYSRDTTAEGRILNTISYEPSTDETQQFSRPCKTAIVDLVLENYKRIEEGLPVIPLLFCMEIEGDKRLITMEDIASRDYSGTMTVKELRRAYKLFAHENPKIRKAAAETFRFARLKYKGDETYAFEPISAPWADAAKAKTLMDARKKSSKSKPKKPNVNWKAQLDAQIKEYESQKKVSA